MRVAEILQKGTICGALIDKGKWQWDNHVVTADVYFYLKALNNPFDHPTIIKCIRIS